MSTLPNEGGDAPEVTDVAQMDDAALDAALQGKETPETEAPEETTEETADKPKYVPHAALHEERLKRQASEREAQELRNWQRQMMERMNAAEERRAAQEAEAAQAKLPSIEDDPIGFLGHKLQTIEEKQAQEREERARQTEEERWTQFAQRDYQQFSSQNPDFPDATNFLAAKRSKMYEALGYAPHQVQQALQTDANTLAQNARATGQSLAGLIYRLAQAEGYAKTDAVEDTASKLATIAKGQETTRNAGAGRAKSNLTPADLLNMSDAEFDANFDKVMK